MTVDHALQITVLSLPALRRLRFPDGDGKQSAERNRAARTVLAALSLAAIVEQQQQGYFLRSRCSLVPEEPLGTLEVVTSAGSSETVNLDPDAAASLLADATAAAEKAGLTWRTDLPPLTPKPDLVSLVAQSRAIVAEQGEDA